MKKLILFAISLILLPAVCYADEFRIVPSLGVKGEYNSNVFFTANDKMDDYLATITPGLELVDRTERFSLNLRARGNQYLYSRETELNAFDQYYDGSAKYAATQTWSLGANAAWTKDSSPDREILTSGLVLGRATRTYQAYGASSEHLLTEKASAVLNYSYSSSNYDDDRYTDLKSHRANLGFMYDIDKYIRTARLRSNFGYARYEGTGITVDNYIGTLGLMWNFHETWQFTFDAGSRYTRSEFDVQTIEFVPPFFFAVVTENQKTEDWGWVAQAMISYKGELSFLNFSYVRDILPASGRSGASQRNALIIDIGRSFTYELKGGIYASYFTNRSDKGQYSASEINENTFTVGPRLRYEFTRDYAVELSYSYTRVDYRVNDTDADRSLVMLRFFAQYPLFE